MTEVSKYVLDRTKDPADMLDEMVAHIYNDRGWLWGLTNMRADPEDVYMVLSGAEPTPGINVQEILAIAKAVCKGAEIVCPIIDHA